MGKFKVGDRVRRVHGTSITTYSGFHDKGFVGIIKDFEDNFGDVIVFDNGHRGYANRYEPAPLFAVGDKVRVVEGEGYIGDTGKVIKIDGDYVYTRLARGIVYFLSSCLEHATTDGEAVPKFKVGDFLTLKFWPEHGYKVTKIDHEGVHLSTKDGSFSWAYPVDKDWIVVKPSTTGFTIPLDEEALPPKTPNQYLAELVHGVPIYDPREQAWVAGKKEATLTFTADLSQVEGEIDRILRKMKRARCLALQLGIPLKEAA